MQLTELALVLWVDLAGRIPSTGKFDRIDLTQEASLTSAERAEGVHLKNIDHSSFRAADQTSKRS